MQNWFAEIKKEDVTVRLGGDGSNGIDVSTIKGWWSTPDAKVSMTARESGDGSHDVEGRSVLYASRTVTIGCVAHGRNRTEVEHQVESLLSMVHGLVRLRVVDARSDTWVDGYVTVSSDVDKVTMGNQSMSVTVTCPRPERLSTDPCVGLMTPGGDSGLGLVFDSTGVLGLPVSFGAVSEATNACTVTNSGTSAASPLIEVSGDMPDGVTITDVATGRQLAYGQPVRWQPLVLDCRSRTASVAGVDVTRGLTARQWPTVPAGGSLSLAVSSGGTGTVKVTCHDTYI